MTLHRSLMVTGVFSAWLGLVLLTAPGLFTTCFVFLVADTFLDWPAGVTLVASALALAAAGTLATFVAAYHAR